MQFKKHHGLNPIQTYPTEKGVVLEEEDAPKRRGFRDGIDLRLGAIEED